MNIGDKAYFVGAGNQQPVPVIIEGIGKNDKLFVKPIDNPLINAYWSDKADFFDSINAVRDACEESFRRRLNKNIQRVRNLKACVS